jgi:hypothetical protein
MCDFSDAVMPAKAGIQYAVAFSIYHIRLGNYWIACLRGR